MSKMWSREECARLGTYVECFLGADFEEGDLVAVGQGVALLGADLPLCVQVDLVADQDLAAI